MKKESRVILSEEQHEALTFAAEKHGMALATFLRWAGIKEAAKLGIHAEQPKVD